MGWVSCIDLCGFLGHLGQGGAVFMRHSPVCRVSSFRRAKHLIVSSIPIMFVVSSSAHWFHRNVKPESLRAFFRHQASPPVYTYLGAT